MTGVCDEDNSVRIIFVKWLNRLSKRSSLSWSMRKNATDINDNLVASLTRQPAFERLIGLNQEPFPLFECKNLGNHQRHSVLTRQHRHQQTVTLPTVL